MALNFPSNPGLNELYSADDRTWQWNGTAWDLVSTGPINSTTIGLAIASTGAFTTLSSTGSTTLGNITADIIPAANVTYDLGSPTQQWRDLYLSNNSIQIGAANLTASGTSVILPANSTIGGAVILVPVIITSIDYPGDDTAADPAGGQTITLYGSNFQSGCVVYVDTVAVAVTTFVSSSQITFVSPAKAVGSYALNVANPDGAVGIAVPGIFYSAVVNWSTASGTLGSPYETNNFSTTLVATGDAPLTYTVANGNSLPGDMTLNSSTGVLSATPVPATASDTTYSFNIVATDPQLQDSTRQFSVTYRTDVITWSAPPNGNSYSYYENTTANTQVALSATSAAGKAISYSLASGSLPSNVAISGSLITGVGNVPQANTAAVIRATAATSNRTADRTLYFTVLTETVTWNSPAAGATFSLANNAPYSQSLSATTGSGRAVNYSIVSGSLPANVTLSGSTVSGTPTSLSANTAVTFRATSSGNTAVYVDRTVYYQVVAAAAPGQQVYTTPGTYSWTAPALVTSVCVVCVGGGGTGDDGNSGDGGGGGGGGGALAYANDIPVTPGQSYTVVVGAGGTNGNGKNTRAQDGGNSTFTVGSFVMTAGGGQGGGPYFSNPGSNGGTFSFANTPGGVTTGGGNGGGGGAPYDGGGGGGGGGGYTGAGGGGAGSIGGYSFTSTVTTATGAGGGGGASSGSSAGVGGGGSGGSGQPNVTGGGGGGSAIFGATAATNGGNGNGGTFPSSQGGAGGFPGGGGGGSWDNNTGLAAAGGNGAVRIIWGTGRSFPSNAGDA